MCNSRTYFVSATLILALVAAANTSFAQGGLALTSPAFAASQRIPLRFTCSGEDKSPPLAWSGVPPAAKTLALIVKDPDAPSGDFVHWVIFNLPASVNGLPEGIPATPQTAIGALQGQNGRGSAGYTGPCPPPGGDHHYHFRLYALDQSLALPDDADAAQVESAMRGHVVAQTEVVGIFSR
ncbi:MAG: YbhB/YbcL family Raf kinase inhibitor-like protein [Candidatus Binataceae bacterium]|jgi:Raf kinase inhibitor-like YbhB/YbcL family protein